MDVETREYAVTYLFVWVYLLAWWAAFRLPMRQGNPWRFFAVIPGALAAAGCLMAMLRMAGAGSAVLAGSLLPGLLFAAPFLIVVGETAWKQRHGKSESRSGHAG